ncbi:MAG TPA: cytochrome C oxidase Cbb3, partial [Zunongwangia profunda]|nr:cytochrome C oxidase Cbb3 [Zunongwangia profunda]
EQGTQIEKNLYSDPDFAKTYEADKIYAKENGEEFVEMRNREIVALIAYLQRLGTDIKVKNVDEAQEADILGESRGGLGVIQ